MDNFTVIERIKTLASKADKIMNEIERESIKQIVEYLINREDMDKKYLNEEKDLEKMWNYIYTQIEKSRKNNEKVVGVTKEIVYGLAIHYWDESEGDLNKENVKDDKLPKKETKKAQKLSSEETDISKDNKIITIEADENHNLTKESYKQLESVFNNDNDIVFKWKGRDVTRAQFNSKEYLSW